MVYILFGLIVGVIAGPGLAWVMNSASQHKGHEIRMQRFREGKGKDPNLSPIGPHKSFAHNAIWFGLVFGVMFAILGMVIKPLG